jgi:rubrerythrin
LSFAKGSQMDFDEETIKSVQGRLDILRKSIVSEENSVNYYKTLLEKTPEDSEESIGVRRMYADLMEEEKQHVERFRELISQWEKKLKELGG